MRSFACAMDLRHPHVHRILSGMQARLSDEDGISISVRSLPHRQIRPFQGKNDSGIFLPGKVIERLGYRSGMIGVLGLGPRCRSGVDIDHSAVGVFAARTLFERGYRRVIGIGVNESWSRKRLDSFVSEARVLKQEARCFSFRIGDIPFQWEKEPRRHFFKTLESALARGPWPLGIFVVADNPAVFVLDYLKAKSLKIPDQVGVLGVNNDPVASLRAGASLSSIELPFFRLGFNAADMAITRKKKMIRLGPLGLVARASLRGFVTEDLLVRQAQEWVERLGGKRVPVEKLCAHLGVNRMQLNRHFRKSLGKSFLDYMQAGRMEMARRLLENKNISVENAALAAGWETPRHFIHLFRRAWGQTPGRWQKENGMNGSL